MYLFYLEKLYEHFNKKLLHQVQGLLAGYLTLRTGHRPGVLTNMKYTELLRGSKRTTDTHVVNVSQDF